jgi:hypothetical protein
MKWAHLLAPSGCGKGASVVVGSTLAPILGTWRHWQTGSLILHDAFPGYEAWGKTQQQESFCLRKQERSGAGECRLLCFRVCCERVERIGIAVRSSLRLRRVHILIYEIYGEESSRDTSSISEGEDWVRTEGSGIQGQEGLCLYLGKELPLLRVWDGRSEV